MNQVKLLAHFREPPSLQTGVAQGQLIATARSASMAMLGDGGERCS